MPSVLATGALGAAAMSGASGPSGFAAAGYSIPPNTSIAPPAWPTAGAGSSPSVPGAPLPPLLVLVLPLPCLLPIPMQFRLLRLLPSPVLLSLSLLPPLLDRRPRLLQPLLPHQPLSQVSSSNLLLQVSTLLFLDHCSWNISGYQQDAGIPIFGPFLCHSFPLPLWHTCSSLICFSFWLLRYGQYGNMMDESSLCDCRSDFELCFATFRVNEWKRKNEKWDRHASGYSFFLHCVPA